MTESSRSFALGVLEFQHDQLAQEAGEFVLGLLTPEARENCDPFTIKNWPVSGDWHVNMWDHDAGAWVEVAVSGTLRGVAAALNEKFGATGV